MGNLNKNVLYALTVALLGVGNITKAESGDLMCHRLAVKAGGGMSFGSAEKNFKAITKQGDLKSEGMNWNAGGGVEYEYMFNPFIGVGLNVEGGYQSLWKFQEANDKGTTTPAAGDTKDDKKNDSESVHFKGFYLIPSVRVLSNFFEDGFVYDEEEESAAGFKLGAILDLGGKLNFGTPDYDSLKKIKIEEADRAKLRMFSGCFGLKLFGELPMGVGFEGGVNLILGDNLEFVKAPEKKEDDNKKEEKDSLLSVGVGLSVFYNLGNLLA